MISETVKHTWHTVEIKEISILLTLSSRFFSVSYGSSFYRPAARFALGP